MAWTTSLGKWWKIVEVLSVRGGVWLGVKGEGVGGLLEERRRRFVVQKWRWKTQKWWMYWKMTWNTSLSATCLICLGNQYGSRNHMDFSHPPHGIDNNNFVFTPIRCPHDLRKRYHQMSRCVRWSWEITWGWRTDQKVPDFGTASVSLQIEKALVANKIQNCWILNPFLRPVPLPGWNSIALSVMDQC